MLDGPFVTSGPAGSCEEVIEFHVVSINIIAYHTQIQ